MERDKTLHIHLPLEKGDELRDQFVEIKGHLGIKNNVEVLRYLIRDYYKSMGGGEPR